jgi:hypothetical protein
MDKVQEPTILSVVQHHQNTLDPTTTCSVRFHYVRQCNHDYSKYKRIDFICKAITIFG